MKKRLSEMTSQELEIAVKKIAESINRNSKKAKAPDIFWVNEKDYESLTSHDLNGKKLK